MKIALEPDRMLPGTGLTIAGDTVIPAPVMATLVELPVEELLERFSFPDTEPAATGRNWTEMVELCPEFNVSGNTAPETLKHVPERLAALIVNGAVPVDFKTIGRSAGVLRATLPKARVDALTLSVGRYAFSFKAKVFVTPAAAAVNVPD